MAATTYLLLINVKELGKHKGILGANLHNKLRGAVSRRGRGGSRAHTVFMVAVVVVVGKDGGCW